MSIQNYQIGQCFSFYGKPLAVSVISLTEGVISYTLSRLDIPQNMTVEHKNIARRFGWEKLDKVIPLAELCKRREIEKKAAEFICESEARKANEISADIESSTCDHLYKNLITETQEPFACKRASKNIRTLLKENFKGTKFSVRTRDASCIDVRWTDGPTKQEVDLLIGKFQIGHVDTYQECYEYNETGFNKLYGGIKYLFTERSFSDELIAKAICAVKERYGDKIGPECTVEAYRKGALYNSGLTFLTDSLQATIRTYLNDMV
ncbi:TPA: LPD29 domain-containing protein [Escherichia coli]